MKKTILFLSTIITVLLSTCVVSMAAIHANTITNQNFEVSYTYKYGSGNISFEYVPGGGTLFWSTDARARSGIFMRYNDIGYVINTMTTVNGSYKTTSALFTNATGGWNYDNWASVSKQKYAKDIYHYADTRINADTVDQAYTLMVE